MNVFELLHRENEAANAAMDQREAELDAFGYGGAPSKIEPEIVGLGLAEAVASIDAAGDRPSMLRVHPSKMEALRVLVARGVYRETMPGVFEQAEHRWTASFAFNLFESLLALGAVRR